MKRVNLFDAAVALFVIVLIPIAYGTYRLFRAPHTVIASVRRVEITKEERRVGGPLLVAKFKIQGSGLRPLLRASLDDQPAIGFVFENPNSADLLVGPVPAGAHDLVLYDGVQEVARAPKSVVVEPAALPRAALVRIRFEGPPEVTGLVKPGDRDSPFDAGSATVIDIAKDAVTLRLTAEPAETGWQYHGLILLPGVELTMTTPRYVLKGIVLSVETEGA
ncbi:MAG TPA: hypothetical protein VLV86_11545 [Vicinamibacterales bacterium]|nr:hypothetical protein [Vicinamibacterales bacterium]